MKRILIGAFVLGAVTVSIPSTGEAQFFTRPGPFIPPSSYVQKRERSYAVWSPVVDTNFPDSSRPTIELLNRIVFGASGVSRVSRFFGIR